MKQASSKNKVLKCVSLGVGAIFIGFILYQLFFYANPHLRVWFAAFAPDDYETANARIEILTAPFWLSNTRLDTIIFPQVSVRYDIPALDMQLKQERNKDFNYDCQSEFAKACEQNTTPGGQKYLMSYDHLMVGQATPNQWVTFVKDGTHIRINGNNKTKEQWESVIDSLEKVSPKGLRVERYQPGF